MTANNTAAQVDHLGRHEVVDTDAHQPVPDQHIDYRIDFFGADFDVTGLIRRIDQQQIYRPDFRRNYIWTLRQASRFIESILLGFPVPSVFLYLEEETRKYLIIDGLQRLTTLHAYHKNRSPHHQDASFSLDGVKPRYQGKTIDDLEWEDRERFENAIIHATVIQQHAPQPDNSTVYHIFDRLNTNSTPMKPQEIRTAIYHGPFQQLIEQRLSKYKPWRDIFGPRHQRSKDHELILRFLALHHRRHQYKQPMQTFLNQFMSDHRNADHDQLVELAEDFETTIKRAYRALGDNPFRPQGSINAAVYDAIMVAIAACPDAPDQALARAHDNLINDEIFLEHCNGATSDEAVVQGRIDMAIQAIRDATLSDQRTSCADIGSEG